MYEALYNQIHKLEEDLLTSRERIKGLVIALDLQRGTPCEQIHHEQEVEKWRNLNAQIVDQTGRQQDRIQYLEAQLAYWIDYD